MEIKKIRTLNANEIECRVQSVTPKGCILLVYKDARVDMKILDETFGMLGWQRSHEVINGNLFCNIDIWDDYKKAWVRKQDVGTESNTEKEKGQASDSFKRAGFNIGIGRELYSAPFTWVNLRENEITEYNGKKQLSKGISFKVSAISYNQEREINRLTIVDNKGAERFNFNSSSKPIEKKEPTVEFDLATVISEVEKIESGLALQDYWNDNTTLHSSKEFVSIITRRKNELTKP